MRKLMLLGIAFVLAGCVVRVAPAPATVVVDEAPPPPPQNPAVARFYDVLAPYGEWVDVAPYGMVWHPYENVVGPGFRPYMSGGHWESTEHGWAFASHWEWGWAPFHYGRWNTQPGIGWVWIPGEEWAPAWVDWRFGGGYVGWAPLGPGDRVYDEDAYWAYVPTARFTEPEFTTYIVPPVEYVRLRTVVVPYRTTVVVAGQPRYAGPPTVEIARVSAHPFVTHTIGAPPARGEIRPIAMPGSPAPKPLPPPNMHPIPTHPGNGVAGGAVHPAGGPGVGNGNTNPAGYNPPPGHGGTPPGQGGIPPGHSNNGGVPPGQINNPGQGHMNNPPNNPNQHPGNPAMGGPGMHGGGNRPPPLPPPAPHGKKK